MLLSPRWDLIEKDQEERKRPAYTASGGSQDYPLPRETYSMKLKEVEDHIKDTVRDIPLFGDQAYVSKVANPSLRVRDYKWIQRKWDSCQTRKEKI